MHLSLFHLNIEFRTKQRRLEPVLENVIQALEPSRSKSTVDNYRTALRSFITYAGRGVTIHAVNANLMEGYQRWLQQRSVSLNTSSCYMRSLRKLFHEAHIPACDTLFKNIFTGNAKTEKRAISQEDMSTLSHLPFGDFGDCPNVREYLTSQGDCPLVRLSLRLALDLFLFSFYAMGMPFVDLAFLRKSQVRDGYITYARRKTGQTIRIKVLEPMQEIINRYARTNTPYLFPLLTATEPRAAMVEYEKLRHLYNRHLKRLAVLANLPKLTSYQVRHTWASIANAQGTDLPVISKAMGHTNTQTTLIYISEIDDHRVDEANEAIVKSILSTSQGDCPRLLS